jgi:hypothetical protein
MTDADTVDIPEVVKPPMLGSSESDEKVRALKRNDAHDGWFWDRAVKPLLLCCLTFAALIVCAYFCIPCVLAIFAFSACTCPFVPVMNIPLWSAIIILVYEGWTVTNGRFGMFWGGLG